jgi:Tol biopolymer transport system component
MLGGLVHPVRHVLAALAVTVLLAPASAAAFPAGTTTLITRPAGDLPLIGIGTGKSGLAVAGDGSVLGGRQISDDGRYVAFVSEADELSSADVDTTTNVYVRDTWTNTTELVSRTTGVNGTGDDGSATNPSISGDGTKVAFEGTTQLDPSDTGQSSADVYVRDLVNDTTTRVPATGNTGQPSLDEDGSHVAFYTSDDLDPVNDTVANGLDVYVWDIAGGTFELASRLNGASTAALDDTSWRPSLSDAGTVVAFETDATDVPGDDDAVSDIAVRTLSTAPMAVRNQTLLASRADGTSGAAGTGNSEQPALSGDGLSVAFVSFATNLVAGDTNGDRDVFRRKLTPALTPTTVRISLKSDGNQIDQAQGAALPSISDDGDKVTFTAFQDDVTPDLPTGITTERVFLRSVTAGTTQAVSRPDGPGTTPRKAGSNAVSGDGLSVAFTGNDPTYSAEDDDTVTRNPHVYVRRLAGYAPTLPDTSDDDDTLFLDRPTGTAPFTGASDVDKASLAPGAASWDARYVAFSSDANNVVPGQDAGDNAFSNAYVRDTVAGTTQWVNDDQPGPISRVAISADGRTAVYTSAGDAFVRDLDTAGSTPVNVPDGSGGPALGTVSPNEVAISGDGTRAAFVTSASLVPADTNGTDDVYVRVLGSTTTILASRADDEALADAGAARPSLDWDGDVVAFESAATNLVGAGQDTNGFTDVVVRDLDAGTTTLASRQDGAGGTLGDGASTAPVLDGDGTTVAFATEAVNLGATGGLSDVVVRDLPSHDSTELPGAGREEQPAISEDGTKVAFVTDAAPAAGDTDSVADDDVYLHDLTTNTTTYVSRGDGLSGAASNGTAGGNPLALEGPAISGNGDCTVFLSLANNLDPDWAGTGVQLGYLRATGTGCPDTAPPETQIDTGPAGETTDTTPEFAFSASERRASFECAVDGEPFAACSSPVSTAPLAAGAHTFRVRARDLPGNQDATPAERSFTIAGAVPPAPQTPAPVPAPVAPSAAAPPAPKDPAKLKVLRAEVDDGVLDMLVEITSNAVVPGADLDVAYESSGRTTRFSVPISSGKAARRGGPVARAAEQRITIRRTLPKTQPKDTGIVELEYAGNDRVQPDEVRLRAASVKALLVRKTTSLSGGRLKVDGTISTKARGVVRVRLGFARPDGSTGFETYNATIAKGAWKIDRTLTGDAAKGGYLSIQFTGYEAEDMRGEQTGKAVP